LHHPGGAENLAVTGCGVLATAIGMVDQAGWRLLPLDGHDQGCDGQFRPHVVTHRPADDFPGEEIEHDGQIEPPFLGWHVGDVGEPNLIGPLGGEFLVEPVRGDRQIVMAVGGAYSESPRRYCPDALVTHEAFDAATKAVELSPGSALFWRNLGHINLAVDRLPEAGIAFDRALAMSSDDVDALCGAALVAQRQGRPKDADAIAKRVKSLEGSCPRVSDGETVVVVVGGSGASKPGLLGGR